MPADRSRDPVPPVPIIAPVELRRVVMRVVGYHVLCPVCGATFAARTRQRMTCGPRCRKRLERLRRMQRQRQEEEREEARIAAAEAALGRRRRSVTEREIRQGGNAHAHAQPRVNPYRRNLGPR